MTEPRVIEPSPASAYPTVDKQWRSRGSSWISTFLPLVGVGAGARVISAYVGPVVGGILIAVLVVLGLALIVVMWRNRQPAVRKRLMRAYPWVEYDATVQHSERTPQGDVLVEIVDGEGVSHAFLMFASDDRWTEGVGRVWAAGDLSSRKVMVSLREGECTGLADSQITSMAARSRAA